MQRFFQWNFSSSGLRSSKKMISRSQLTPDGKRVNSLPETSHVNAQMPTKANDEDFFDLLTKSQSKRMDDQRCSLKVIGGAVGGNKEMLRKPLVQQNSLPATIVPKENRFDFKRNFFLSKCSTDKL